MSSPEAAATRQEAVGNIWMLNRMEEIHWRHESRVLKEGDKILSSFIGWQMLGKELIMWEGLGEMGDLLRGQLKSEKVLLSSLRIFIKVTILSDPI